MRFIKAIWKILFTIMLFSILASVGFADQTDTLQSASKVTKDGSLVSGTAALESPLAATPAQSNARLAILVTPFEGVIRSKGVTTVTNPSEGEYCILPSTSARINVKKITPVVTVEWGKSSGSISDGMHAYYRASGMGCPSGYIEVITFDENYGSPVKTNGVAFTMIVQ